MYAYVHSLVTVLKINRTMYVKEVNLRDVPIFEEWWLYKGVLNLQNL